jgi:hypothetical protein
LNSKKKQEVFNLKKKSFFEKQFRRPAADHFWRYAPPIKNSLVSVSVQENQNQNKQKGERENAENAIIYLVIKGNKVSTY